MTVLGVLIILWGTVLAALVAAWVFNAIGYNEVAGVLAMYVCFMMITLILVTSVVIGLRIWRTTS